MSAQFADRFNAVRYYLGTLGLSIVPIPPGSKAPTGKGWNQPGGYYEPRHIETALEFFKTHLKHNLGLVHEASSTAALDIDHNEYTCIAFAALGLDLAEFLTAYPTPRIRGNPEKLAKPIYRVPAGVTLTAKKLSWPHPDGPDPKTGGKRLVTVFELRTGKVQDVLPPSLHPLGAPYGWHTDPEKCPIAEMPPEILELWQHWSEYEHDLLTACPWHKPEPRSSPKPREHKEASNGVIQAFNQAHDVRELLKKYGYKPKGNDRFIAPGSTSGLAGVKVFDDGRVYSHHGSDPLADGHSHDAFSVFCILAHKGDMRAAVREAAKLLGMDRPQKEAPEPPPWVAEEIPIDEEDLDPDVYQVPPSLDPKMLYGTAGDFAKHAAQKSEVNRVAAAANALALVACNAGRDTYQYIGDTAHYPALYTMHVGRTSIGGKGDALSLVDRVVMRIEDLIRQGESHKGQQIPPDLLCNNHSGGLSSGEGLIMLIHDEVFSKLWKPGNIESNRESHLSTHLKLNRNFQ